MAIRYLLPCPCGQTVPVQSCQAGQTVTCRCGAALEVPTMLALVNLQRGDAEPARSPGRPFWGMTDRIILVGAMTTLAASAMAFYLFWNRPILSSREPDREMIRQQIEPLSPLETWQVWHIMLREGLDRRNPAGNPLYVEAVFRYRLALGVALFFAASGGGLIIAAVWIGRGQPAQS